MTDREKLIELVHDARMNALWHNAPNQSEYITDMLIDGGVTFAKDTNVPGKWISVKDRLPEGFTSCIVYRKGIYGGHFSMLRYSQELGWHFYDSEWGDVTVDDVTHWMPLPEPPKGE